MMLPACRACCGAAMQYIPPQALSNAAWALARLSHFNDQLFEDIAGYGVKADLSCLSAKELARLAWAFAKNQHENAQLFGQLAQVCVAVCVAVCLLSAATSAASCCRCCCSDDDGDDTDAAHDAMIILITITFVIIMLALPLCRSHGAGTDARAQVAVDKLPEFDAQALSTLAWACATLGHAQPALLSAIADRARAELRAFEPSGAAHASPLTMHKPNSLNTSLNLLPCLVRCCKSVGWFSDWPNVCQL